MSLTIADIDLVILSAVKYKVLMLISIVGQIVL